MDKKNKSTDGRFFLAVTGIFLVLIAIVTGVLFMINGKTVISNGGGELKTQASLMCKTERIEYPFMKDEEALSRNLELNVVFNDDRITSISLVHKLTYGDNDKALTGELRKHIDFELEIQKSGVRADEIFTNSKHDVFGNVYQMSLYVEGGQLKKNTLKYFMLDDLQLDRYYSRESVAKILVSKGFDCVGK